ncbi:MULTISPECIES: hypothetical protein [Bifidobacterium]|uniref:Uncharacterized protein n=1 Tax=Bifidobacterium myosotis TaxID=1630166 RepID=A0A261FFW5_9BIFI|nr:MULTISPECIES: hypothetical protein [Bifidobacterium]OZG58024.1 hypothetical protein BMYO_1779 [Bifidobacterium myosotis]TPF93255.1 hypothetical protein BG22_07535 [Bifidobacterium sp. UTBIF-78]
MLSFIEDNSHPFDYVERLEGVPEGVEARVVRIAPDLPFDAMVAMPADRVPADVEAEPVGNHVVIHHAFPDLGPAEDWVVAWVNRCPASDFPRNR